MGLGAGLLEANVFAFVLPPIQGLSLTGGVEGYLQVRGSATTDQLQALNQELAAAANDRPELTNVRVTLDTGIPRYQAHVDREKAKAIGVPIDEIFTATPSTFGALYVNDFTLEGRLWQGNLQSEADFRSEPQHLRRVFVRSTDGQLLPLSSVVTLERTTNADILNRYNLYAAAKVLAEPGPGFTSGDAKLALGEVTAGLAGGGSQHGWIGDAYQLDAAAGAAGTAFGLGLLMVFLILAAQYERWTLPLAVATAVPFAVLGAAGAALLRGLPNDIYFQVGLLVLIGLAAKNAILIVQFAAQNCRERQSVADAALAAARQRFRAIIMTALTFIIGTLPLMAATGAEAANRQAIGTVVVGGMVAASTLALLFVPLAFKLVDDAPGWFERRRRPRQMAEARL